MISVAIMFSRFCISLHERANLITHIQLILRKRNWCRKQQPSCSSLYVIRGVGMLYLLFYRVGHLQEELFSFMQVKNLINCLVLNSTCRV